MSEEQKKEEKEQRTKNKEQIYPEPTVGAVIYNEKGEILLIKNPHWSGLWHIPSGHVELEETCEVALKREVKEEVGIEIGQIEFIGWYEAINPEFYYRKAHLITLRFCAKYGGGQIKKSEEAEEFIWKEPNQALKELEVTPSATQAIKFYLAHLEKKQDKSQEYLNNWKRALADYDNLRKEVAKEREEMGKFASIMAAMSFLEVYENLKKAFRGDFTNAPMAIGAANGTNEQWEAWKKGIEQVVKQFADVLKQMGIEEIKTVGEKFDPKWHEAVGEESVEGKEPGVIVREVEGGYKMGERVIKAAKVIVAK